MSKSTCLSCILIHYLYIRAYEFICPLDLLPDPLNMIPKGLGKVGYPSVFRSIGITLKESGVNFRGHINSHEDGIRERTICNIYGSYRSELISQTYWTLWPCSGENQRWHDRCKGYDIKISSAPLLVINMWFAMIQGQLQKPPDHRHANTFDW